MGFSGGGIDRQRRLAQRIVGAPLVASCSTLSILLYRHGSMLHSCVNCLDSSIPPDTPNGFGLAGSFSSSPAPSAAGKSNSGRFGHASYALHTWLGSPSSRSSSTRSTIDTVVVGQYERIELRRPVRRPVLQMRTTHKSIATSSCRTTGSRQRWHCNVGASTARPTNTTASFVVAREPKLDRRHFHRRARGT